MSAIELCHTATLGGHVELCDNCATSASATTRVATGAAADIAFHNKAVIYAILFRAVAEALRSVAADIR